MVTQKKRGNMLRKKLLRDIRREWKSFAAVLIICMLSVVLYCGIDASWQGMQRNLDAQFAECNLADIWVHGEVGDRMVQQIAGLPGVRDAQRRVNGRAEVISLPGKPDLDVYMSDGEARINKHMLFEGEAWAGGQKNACILNEAFAEAHGLRPGDSIEITVYGQRLQLYISGIGYQAEYVVYSDGVKFKADPLEFGYAILSPGTLSMLPMTQVSVTIEAGADEYAVKQSIEDLLDDVQKKVTLRTDSMGLKMAIEEVDQIRILGQVFPVVFFFVAALITWSTMTRLVENQRLQIGTLRAMGYTKGQLMWHYISFGFWIALLASILGLILAYFFFGTIIVEMLRSLYVMPGGGAYLDPPTSLVITGITVLIASGASFLSCRSALREVPASLLRPKPPKNGKRVLLERIPFLWRWFSFSNKMVIRNMTRNISRVLIGLVGVVGCVALLLTGFGLRDSMVYVMDNHYGNTMRYDVRASLDADGLTDDYLDALRARSGALEMESVMEGSVEVYLNGWEHKSLFVIEEQSAMYHLVDENGTQVTLGQNGIAVTEKFREETGVSVGDVLEIRAANGKTQSVEVAQVITMQLGQGIYMTRGVWRQLDLYAYSPTALLLRGGDIDTAALADLEGVNTVRTLAEEKDSNGVAIEVMDLIVGLMVLFAGALALVVLYMLGRLNFFERQRELATLMVLGFYPRENKRIILRENMIIAVLGIPLGLVLGPYLHRFVLESGLPNTLEFIPHIERLSWILTPLITLAFAQIVNWIVGGKFKKVNMVEALKSVE